jgi:hypothetical protein
MKREKPAMAMEPSLINAETAGSTESRTDYLGSYFEVVRAIEQTLANYELTLGCFSVASPQSLGFGTHSRIRVDIYFEKLKKVVINP